jgi:hypothetical protein
VKAFLKAIGVLLPGALLGAGAGVLLAGFQVDPASPLVNTLQTIGIALMVGSIVLRIILAQRGFAISGSASLAFNTGCVFLTAFVTYGLLAGVAPQGGATMYAVIGLAWIPCLALAALGQILFAAWRNPVVQPPKS